MIDIPIGFFAVGESDVATDHGMRLGDGVDFDRHDTGALGGVSRDASLSGSGIGDGLFHWLGRVLQPRVNHVTRLIRHGTQVLVQLKERD